MRARAFIALALVLAALLFTPPAARAELEPIAYTVVRGDTAHRIASRHGLTLRELETLNDGLHVDRLRAGQRLVVGHGRPVRHRVRPHETLSAIAERYGVHIHELLRWNAGLDQRQLTADRELRLWARRDDPPSLSRGRCDRGELVHGITIPEHRAYVVRDSERAWVTRKVADVLTRSFDHLLRQHPSAPRIQIRDASRRDGGRLHRHHSHQSGRDVDIAYYQRRCGESVCNRRRTRPEHLDAALEWTLIESWLRSGEVEYIFVDHALQAPLYEAARAAGATREELSTWFQWPRGRDVRVGVIRHVPQHADHLHVRFACAADDPECIPSNPRS
jgi:LysM repeat protein/murein endopeptidase